MQFVPEKAVYVYFRYTSTEVLMTVMNFSPEAGELDLDRFQEVIEGQSSGQLILRGESVALTKALEIEGRSIQFIHWNR